MCRVIVAKHETRSQSNVTEVVGISGHYPGKGIGELGFMENLVCEQDLPQTVPHQRWDLEYYYTPEAKGDLSMYVRHACFVNGLDNFDARLFR